MKKVDVIEALLPQTQCGECDFEGCRPYAEAIAQGTAEVNRCPPGGVETLKALGEYLNINIEKYIPQVRTLTRSPSVAVIQEEVCIGCTKCIQACPVDAILGTGKMMHSVIQHECTGCGLCVEPCPVDCIEMVSLPEPDYEKDRARKRYQAKQSRLIREQHEKQQLYRQKRQVEHQSVNRQQEIKAKQNYILQALSRVNAKKNE